MKKSILMLSLAAGISLMAACKKDKSEDLLDEQTTQQVTADDEARIAASDNEELDDANRIIAMHPRLRGINFMGIYNGLVVPCNTTIDTSLISQGKVTVTFNGLNCNGTRNRTGTMIIQLPYDANTNTVTPWSTAGCQLSLTMNNVEITNVSSGKSITINSTRTITNVNGGLIDNTPTFATPILHHATGTTMVTFDNGTTRSWNFDRNRLIERTNNVTTISITGNASQGGFSNVSVWGVNRAGNTFFVSVDSPIVLSSDCNYNAMSGVRVHHGVVRELTVTFGVDLGGRRMTKRRPYGYKLNWTSANGQAHQVVRSY